MHESLLQELENYSEAAIILDFFPANAAEESDFFANNAKKIQQFMPETIKALIKDESIGKQAKGFQLVDNVLIQSIENSFCQNNSIDSKLIDKNTFFPTQLVVLQK